ncbi:hypothetical protein Fmac_028381 [Flemingia macrophylla]|uniref:Uncharacterized protein n=1 Tax=Flemingia macrophylla TaxID=520843 RepID=A0ABD1L7C2_9FABA
MSHRIGSRKLARKAINQDYTRRQNQEQPQKSIFSGSKNRTTEIMINQEQRLARNWNQRQKVQPRPIRINLESRLRSLKRRQEEELYVGANGQIYALNIKAYFAQNKYNTFQKKTVFFTKQVREMTYIPRPSSKTDIGENNGRKHNAYKQFNHPRTFISDDNDVEVPTEKFVVMVFNWLYQFDELML